MQKVKVKQKQRGQSQSPPTYPVGGPIQLAGQPSWRANQPALAGEYSGTPGSRIPPPLRQNTETSWQTHLDDVSTATYLQNDVSTESCRWSGCLGYVGKTTFPRELVGYDLISYTQAVPDVRPGHHPESHHPELQHPESTEASPSSRAVATTTILSLFQDQL
jgi:hypothetical protein